MGNALQKGSMPPLARSRFSKGRTTSLDVVARKESAQSIDTVDPKLMINPDKSPKKYKKFIEGLIVLLEKHPGLPKDGGSRFPPNLMKLGAKFGERNPWTAERHLVFLTNAEGSEIYGWSKVEERKSHWRVEYVWINRKFRKLGLGRYILGYIESLCVYPNSVVWEAPEELKLLSGGVDALI